MRKATTGEGLREAVIIATRNRPDDLKRTLASIARQEGATGRLVLIVDSSDAEGHGQNRNLIDEFSLPSIRHLPYPHPPSLASQRNHGLEHLPDSVKIVHFVDDDVTVLPGYFRQLAETLRVHPEAGGIGGLVLERGHAPGGSPPWTKRLFLLDSRTPGRVLLSGQTTPATANGSEAPYPVEWLSGCSSTYRRDVFDRCRFDHVLRGYSLHEDLDFSYRVGQTWPLLIEPRARLIHHVSPVNRYHTERKARALAVHRYWFIKKNIRHPLRKPAFWWSILGQVLARLTSRKAERTASLRGLLHGMWAIWQREHPLLRNDTDSA